MELQAPSNFFTVRFYTNYPKCVPTLRRSFKFRMNRRKGKESGRRREAGVGFRSKVDRIFCESEFASGYNIRKVRNIHVPRRMSL